VNSSRAVYVDRNIISLLPFRHKLLEGCGKEGGEKEREREEEKENVYFTTQ